MPEGIWENRYVFLRFWKGCGRYGYDFKNAGNDMEAMSTVLRLAGWTVRLVGL